MKLDVRLGIGQHARRNRQLLASEIDEWEQRKAQAWDREQQQARARSSAELHEELANAEQPGP